jgi:hypothetical protein
VGFEDLTRLLSSPRICCRIWSSLHARFEGVDRATDAERLSVEGIVIVLL